MKAKYDISVIANNLDFEKYKGKPRLKILLKLNILFVQKFVIHALKTLNDFCFSCSFMFFCMMKIMQ